MTESTVSGSQSEDLSACYMILTHASPVRADIFNWNFPKPMVIVYCNGFCKRDKRVTASSMSPVKKCSVSPIIVQAVVPARLVLCVSSNSC